MYAQSRNHFVLSACAAVLVEAYKKQIAEYHTVMPLALSVSDDAPETFEALKANAANGVLSVTSKHSDHAIYGRDGNVTFRVFHDYGHLLYNKEFVCADEVELANIQWLDLQKHIPAEWLHVAKVVYFADTVEQSLFCEATGEFPVDQKAFVLNILNTQLVLAFAA